MKLTGILLLAILNAGLTACESRGAQGSGRPTIENLVEASSRAQVEAPSADADFAPRIVRFAWSPPGADAAAYAMTEPEDQHLIAIVGSGGSRTYPVVIALHGQPK